MKRLDLMKHLKENHCELFREGAKHSVIKNILNNKVSSIPRHSEVENHLARKICRDLGVIEITKK